MPYPFDILNTPGYTPAMLTERPFVQRDAADAVQTPGELKSRHAREAEDYKPKPELTNAIATAVATGQPLLLTGEPGTGKTQAAYHVASKLKLGDVLDFQVRSTSVARDLAYTFDSVGYMAAALHAKVGEEIQPGDFVRFGPLYHAFTSETPRVLLLDEIDKAPRDFPNDLLHQLDQWSFTIEEEGGRVIRASPYNRPIVIITSNGERQLPDPFLRRCIYHHIEYDEETVRDIVRARWDTNRFPGITWDVTDEAIKRLGVLRNSGLAKRPAIGELLVWLGILSMREVKALPVALVSMPGLECVVKTDDDLRQLANR